MKKMEKLLLSLLIFLSSFSSFGEENLASLLFAYLKNDLKLQKASLTAESKALDYDKTKIENGISVSLSSGTVKIQSSASGTKYTFSPSATLAIPAANNTKLTATLPVTQKSGYSTSNQNGTYLDNGSIKLSTGIISASPLKRKISLLEAERAYIEAERAVKSQALTVENEFYTCLKNLYSYASTVLQKKNDLHDDEVDLKVLDAKGYSKSSASYRTKYLECQSDRRDVHEAQRKLERETAIFAIKCGLEYNQLFSPENFSLEKAEEIGDASFKAVMEFLPMEVPGVEMEDVLSYKSENYTTRESAQWSKYIGDLKLKSDYTMELDIYGGYTFNESTSKYDTVDGGFSFDWRGISASAGVSLPTGKNLLPFDSSSSGTASTNPVFNFSLTLNPNTWRLARIDKKQDEITSKINEITVKSAADSYDTDVIEKLTERGDLRWSQKSYAEEYDMYSQLEYDMDKWLAAGIVTESEYLDAADNRDKAQLNMLINAVEQIIYNNKVKLLFVEDSKNEAKNK